DLGSARDRPAGMVTAEAEPPAVNLERVLAVLRDRPLARPRDPARSQEDDVGRLTFGGGELPVERAALLLLVERRRRIAQPGIAQPGRPPHSGDRPGADPDRRVGRLQRLGLDARVVEGVPTAMEAESRLGP